MSSLVSKIDSRDAMRATYDRVYTTRKKSPLLKALILLSDFSAEELEDLVLNHKKLSRIYKASVKPMQSKDLYKLELEKKIRERPVRGSAVLDTSHTGFWIAYTDERGYFVRHVLEELFNKLYPLVARVYFNHLQISKLLDSFQEAYGSSVVTYIALRRTDRQMAHTRYLDRQSFEIRDETKLILFQGSFNGRGLVQMKYGRFTDFEDRMLPLFLDFTSTWKNFFSKRERQLEEGQVKLYPYSLAFGFEPNATQFKELEKQLSTDYSISVIHGGNPYFAMSLSDYADGSSLGMTILGKTVTITPMLRAAPFSLWKLTHRVQRVIGEGEIADIKPLGVS